MDLDRAQATLGVDASTSLKDAHGAYVLRAKMLHPDQYGSSEHLRHEAERAMSQLTEAWDVIQRAGENRHTPAAATTAAGWGPPADLRLPVQGECDFCGSRPAKPVSLRGVTGMVLWFSWMRLEQELCRACAIAMYREAQARTLTFGWWGMVTPLATLVAIVRNGAQLGQIEGWSRPSGRDPHVVTPLTEPIAPTPAVARRGGPWLGTIGAVLAAVIIASNVSTGSSGGGRVPAHDEPSQPVTDTAIGTCLTDSGFEVSCVAADAAWRITGIGPSCGSAPAVFEDLSTGRTYCAVRN